MKTSIVWKLTAPNLTTYGGYPWTIGKRHVVPGVGELCGPGWIHAYTSPALALLLNPIHAAYKPCRLFMGRGLVGKTDHGLKVGCSELTLIREVVVPQITLEQSTTFALYCALAVDSDPAFIAWAEAWLAGENRSVGAEAAARAAAWAAARAGDLPLDDFAAAWAAAEEAARAAAWAAGEAVAAAWAAAWAAEVAATAAWAAAQAGDLPLDDFAAAAILPYEIK